MRYQHIMRMVAEAPWALRPERLAAILDLLAYRAEGHRLSQEEIEARIGAAPQRRQAVMTAGSVAVIPLAGVIVPKAGLMTQMSGATSVQQFGATLQAAVQDPSVDGILIEIDSPGGMTDLVPEVAGQIRAARRVKPIVAIANTDAASAAYWLGSQASEFVVTPSGSVGSIGVFAAHEDVSAQMEADGVKTTLISAGKFKTESSPFAPLTEEARAAIQDRVNQFYSMFVADVAKGRGVGVQAVRDGFGQGRIVTAKDALAQGMVDRIATFEDTLKRLQQTSAAGARMGAVLPGPGLMTMDEARRSIMGDAYIEAAALPVKGTKVVDEPWDGPAAVAAAPNEEDALRWMHAWVDSSMDPTQKGAYKFPHHAGPGAPANINGVRNALARVPQANIPAGDVAGVEAHLHKHLDDWKANHPGAIATGGIVQAASIALIGEDGHEHVIPIGTGPPGQAVTIDFTQGAVGALSFAHEAESVRCAVNGLVTHARSLCGPLRDRRLTAAKREELFAVRTALSEAETDVAELLAETEPHTSQPDVDVLRERARYERGRAL